MSIINLSIENPPLCVWIMSNFSRQSLRFSSKRDGACHDSLNLFIEVWCGVSYVYKICQILLCVKFESWVTSVLADLSYRLCHLKYCPGELRWDWRIESSPQTHRAESPSHISLFILYPPIDRLNLIEARWFQAHRYYQFLFLIRMIYDWL